MLRSVCVHKSEALFLFKKKPPHNPSTASPPTIYSLTPNHLQPHPQPLSEWRGEWRLLVGWERMVSGIIDNCTFESKKSFWEWHPLPRRGLGRLFSRMKETPFSIVERRFLAMKRASLHIEETPSLFVNNTIYSPLHSERGRGWGFRKGLMRLLLCKNKLLNNMCNTIFFVR